MDNVEEGSCNFLDTAFPFVNLKKGSKCLNQFSFVFKTLSHYNRLIIYVISDI